MPLRRLLALALAGSALILAQAPPHPARPAIRTGVLHANYNPGLPTLFLIGDSTVKNSWDEGADELWGWGHPLAGFFDLAKINVENQALGGTSSHSYLTGGHWERVLALVRRGDFVIMQFGHNDGGPGGSLPGVGDQVEERANRKGDRESVRSYGWYLRKFIAETQAKGATPIVCSLIPRNDWAGGKVRRADSGYGAWAAAAAEAGGAFFIDLNALIADRYDKLGEEAVKPYFPKEHTHTGWDGAVLNAECVVEGIRRLAGCPLRSYLAAAPEPKK